jgi:hypothetical protein
MTAAGTIEPAAVVIVGASVAALQHIAGMALRASPPPLAASSPELGRAIARCTASRAKTAGTGVIGSW